MSIDLLRYINIDTVYEQSTLSNIEGIPFVNRFACELTVNNNVATTLIPFQVLSCDVPSFSLNVSEIELFGERRFSFKNRDYTDVGITFLETPNLKLRTMFFEWMSDAYNVLGANQVTRQYMKDIEQGSILTIFPIDGQGNAEVADRFEGVIPYDISGIPYVYADQELIKTTVKFKYRYHTLEKRENK